jgi:hypothetical protein
MVGERESIGCCWDTSKFIKITKLKKMFSSDNVLVMVLGIFTALGFIIGSTYFVYQMFAKSTKEILVRFILVVFTALVALFIVDKTIAWKVNLIAPEQNEQLFDLIRTLVLMIFSYYFGTKDSGKKNEED